MSIKFFLAIVLMFAILVFFHKLFWQRHLRKKDFVYISLATALVFIPDYARLLIFTPYDILITSRRVSMHTADLLLSMTIPIILYVVNCPHNQSYDKLYHKKAWQHYYRR